MYNINRQEAADILWVSTRSIDRYIKSWKIRAEKQWKIILLNDNDVKSLSWGSVIKHKIIVSPKVNTESEISVKQELTNGLVKKRWIWEGIGYFWKNVFYF